MSQTYLSSYLSQTSQAIPIYTLLHPGRARRLAYSMHLRTHRNIRMQATNLDQVAQVNRYTTTNDIENTETYRNSNCDLFKKLLLKTQVMINKENGICCAICVENILQNTEIIRKLECNHVYHINCIDNWLVFKMQCPLCKHDI